MILIRLVLNTFKWLLILPIQIYRYTISTWLPNSCRHDPTCSLYTIEAIKTHGAFKGLWLGFKRILKCHPWGTFGYDPVPPKKAAKTRQQ